MSLDNALLDGQRVLVLGTGGIAAELAATVASAGAEPVVAGRDSQRAGR